MYLSHYSYFLRLTIDPKRSDMAGKLLNAEPSGAMGGLAASREGFDVFLFRSSGNVGISFASQAVEENDKIS